MTLEIRKAELRDIPQLTLIYNDVLLNTSLLPTALDLNSANRGVLTDIPAVDRRHLV